MGAGASVDTPNTNVDDDGEDANKIVKINNIKQLPDAIDEAIYAKEKWPLILDLDGNASRFLKYQRGSYLLGFNPGDMEKSHLRKLLVGAIEHGSNFTIKYNSIESAEQLTQNFAEGFFPREILKKYSILDEKCWTTLLRPEEGEKQPHEFMPNDGFCLILLTEDKNFPEEMHEFFEVIQLGGDDEGGGGAGGGGATEEGDSMEIMFGAKEVIKNR